MHCSILDSSYTVGHILEYLRAGLLGGGHCLHERLQEFDGASPMEEHLPILYIDIECERD